MPNRQINRVVVGTSGTLATELLGFTELNFKDIELGVKPQGDIHCRWHYIVRRDGLVEKGRAEHEYPFGLGRYNSDSLYICVVGGVDASGGTVDNFSSLQKRALRDLIRYLFSVYEINFAYPEDTFQKPSFKFPFDLKELLKCQITKT